MLIYKITAPDGRSYIGSTVNPIELRWSVHKSGFVRFQMGKAAFCSSYTLFADNDPDECIVETMQVFPAGTARPEILKRERELIKSSENCVNAYGVLTDAEKVCRKREYMRTYNARRAAKLRPI